MLYWHPVVININKFVFKIMYFLTLNLQNEQCICYCVRNSWVVRCLSYFENLHLNSLWNLHLKPEMTIFVHYSQILSQFHSQWVHTSILVVKFKMIIFMIFKFSRWASAILWDSFYATDLSLKVPRDVQMDVMRPLAIMSHHKWRNTHRHGNLFWLHSFFVSFIFKTFWVNYN